MYRNSQMIASAVTSACFAHVTHVTRHDIVTTYDDTNNVSATFAWSNFIDRLHDCASLSDRCAYDDDDDGDDRP